MEGSWLVQRLEKPFPRPLFGADNPFAFGGGLKNGGLSDEAMGLIREIWRFDYMGAAEYEFGAVPRALQKLAQADLAASSFTVPLAEVPKNWRDKSRKTPAGNGTIYVICPANDAAEVEERIGEWARNEHPSLRDGLRLTNALRPVEEWDTKICGWLELDNGFLFFTDREMWEKACALFGVAVTSEAAAA